LLGTDGVLPCGAFRHSINLSGCNRLTDVGIAALKALRRLSYLELAVRPSPHASSVDWSLVTASLRLQSRMRREVAAATDA
jgi:hypothetical protein